VEKVDHHVCELLNVVIIVMHQLSRRKVSCFSQSKIENSNSDNGRRTTDNGCGEPAGVESEDLPRAISVHDQIWRGVKADSRMEKKPSEEDRKLRGFDGHTIDTAIDVGECEGENSKMKRN
jgi:hypothetical protein